MNGAPKVPSGRPRVAVTGIGVKTPAGCTVDEAFATVLAGRCVAQTLPELVDAASPVTMACVVPEFDLSPYLGARELQQVDRNAFLGVAAAVDAVADADTLASPFAGLEPDRVAVAVGITSAGLLVSFELGMEYVEVGGAAFPPFLVPRLMSNATAARIAMLTGSRGPCLSYSTACASGSTAIGEAADKIRAGRLDAAVAGGVDAPVNFGMVTAFSRMRALSSRVDEPAAASRPFDRDRDGFVMGEGAAFVVLERLDLALARGARIYGEVAGYGSNCDAFHIVKPAPTGETAAACMTAAIRDARLAPEQIGHVNAHGTSTVLNDRAEAVAIDRVFGTKSPPTTATKGVTGHMIGGAGAFEAVIALLSAGRGVVPPVANFGGGPDADLVDVVAGEPRRVEPAPVLSNSFGFGGHNSCLVLMPPSEGEF